MKPSSPADEVSAAFGSRMRALVLVMVLLGTSGCMFSAKARQARHEEQVRQLQLEQAADRNRDSKADIAYRQKQTQHEARVRRLQQELAARGDPDSLAASALFGGVLSGFSSGASLDVAARAVAAAPGRADLVFLHLQLCASAPGCDAAPLEARLQQLDPENGTGWIYLLVRADRANDGVQWRRAREALARSKRVDLYLHQIVSRLAAAAAGKAGFDFGEAALELLNIEAAFAPTFDPVSKACSARDVQQPEVLAQCREISAAFRHADTALFEAYGTTLALQLWPQGSPEALAVGAERRALRYRVDLMVRQGAKINSPQARKTLATLITRHPTEQTAYRALFLDLGLNPDPPPGWTEGAAGS